MEEQVKSLGVKLSWAFFAAFLLSGLLGFFPNPFLGEHGLFAANTGHNLVHIVSALAFLAVARIGEKQSVLFMLGFGVLYALTGLVGFAVTADTSHGMLLGFIHINTFDNYLHIGLGAAIFAGGVFAKKSQTMKAF